jgi:hypothetical protein
MTMNMVNDMDDQGHGQGPHGHGSGHTHEPAAPYAPSQDVFADTGGPEISLDHHAAAPEGVPPFFQTDSLAAVPVTQRAAESHNVRAASCVVPSKVVGHRKGRRAITLSCPATTVAGTPLGFQVSDQRAYLDVNVGFQVNPGDSIRIESEAEVWIAPLPGQTSGYCQYVETFDAPSGPQP